MLQKYTHIWIWSVKKRRRLRMMRIGWLLWRWSRLDHLKLEWMINMITYLIRVRWRLIRLVKIKICYCNNFNLKAFFFKFLNKILTVESDMSEREDGVFGWREFDGFEWEGECNIFFEDGVDLNSVLNEGLIW